VATRGNSKERKAKKYTLLYKPAGPEVYQFNSQEVHMRDDWQLCLDVLGASGSTGGTKVR